MLAGLVPVPGARVQAIAGSHSCGYRHAVICYRRDRGGWFSSYARSEREVARPELVAAVNTAMRGDCGEGVADSHALRDLLLCTHGTRDRCCAKLGGALYCELSGALPDRTRLWRTSHTGGHRFAPTGISFPEGLMWAGLDPEVTVGVLRRTLPIDEVARHLRGCTGIGGGVQQAADAEGFSRYGWAWLDYERRATVTDDDGELTSVRVEFRNGETVDRMTASVGRGRVLPIAACGEPISAAVKQTTELVVRAVD